MEDTLLTVNNYEGARLEYDAYRFDMEILQNLDTWKIMIFVIKFTIILDHL